MAYVSSQRIDSLPVPLQQRIRAHLRADANEATESIAISKLVAYNMDSWFLQQPGEHLARGTLGGAARASAETAPAAHQGRPEPGPH